MPPDTLEPTNMKLRGLTFSIVVALALVSCNQNDNGDTPQDPAASPASSTQDQADPAAITQTEGQPATTPSTAPGSASGDTASPAPDTAATDTPRVPIDTPRLEGSIALAGGRIDALTLKDYTVDIDEDSPNVEILEPVGTGHAYYTLFGWAPGSGLSASDVPGPNTEWQVAEGDTLTSDSPVTLSWESPAGLVFRRTVSVDEDFMFTVTQSVENTGESEISAAPYGIIARHGEPVDLKNFFVLHEGVVAMADGKLNEIDYSDMPDMDMLPSEGARAEVTQVSETGWIGFTDHYWMTTLIPGDTGFKQVSKYDDSRDIYQTEAVMPTMSLAPGESREATTQVFAGAKEYETIRDYQQQGVDRFIDSIDWGWFFFLTKPIFWLLHQLHQLIGNMGWSIIALTVILKAILFPLAFKSYVSMAKMKELQPQMIIAGGSAYPREIDFQAFRDIADEVGAYLLVDMAHFAGLVAGGTYPNPVPLADVCTTTTHKTLRGPRGGMIISRDADLGKKFNSAVFPGLQGGPLMHVIAAKAVAFGEALEPSFKQYAKDVIANARALSEVLVGGGLGVVSGGTDCHMVLVDLRPKGVTGKAAEAALERAGLTCNKNAIPFDPEKPFVTSGVRLGTSAGTTRGFGEAEFRKVGELVLRVIDALSANAEGDAAVEAAVLEEVQALCKAHPIYADGV